MPQGPDATTKLQQQVEALTKTRDDLKAEIAKLKEDKGQAAQQLADAKKELGQVRDQLADAQRDLVKVQAEAEPAYPWVNRDTGKRVRIVEQGNDTEFEYEGSGKNATLPTFEFNQQFEAEAAPAAE